MVYIPIEIMLKIREYCDVETKVALYKLGIPMQKIKIPVSLRILFFTVKQYDWGENYLKLPLTSTKELTILKGKGTAYIISIYNRLTYELDEFMGYDLGDGRYNWVNVYYGLPTL
jgi:hypothetical protein